MKRPTVRPLLGATAGIVLCAGTAAAAAKPTAEPPAPPPAKPGWVERVAAAPKKLAFWDKDKPAAPAPAPAAAPAPAKKQPAAAKSKKPSAPAAAAPNPASAQSKKGASATPPAPAAPADPPPAKKSFLSKLPSLPFITKPEAAPAPASAAPAAESTAAPKKGSAAGRAAAKPTEEAGSASPPAPPESEKKAGLFELGRLWPGGKKPAVDEAPAAVAQSKTDPAARPRPPATGQPAPAPAASDAAPDDKPSLWSRMTAAITLGSPSPEKPHTTPVPKGLAPLGATAPGSNTFVITKDDSAFFSFGPQQATPPDAYLSTGTVVTLTNKNWGWATVQLPDGRVGVVDRAALRPALISDLIPSQRPGDALMASLSPDKLKGRSTPNFILPAAEMPELPTSGDAAGAGAPGNPLLLPFSPDDITEPGQLPPLPEIQPLPEPPAPSEAESPDPASAPEPAAPSEPAPSEAKPAPEPAEPAPPAEAPASPASPTSEPSPPAE